MARQLVERPAPRQPILAEATPDDHARQQAPEQPDALELVPSRPALQPGVEFVGAMSGSGFQHQQWLVQRDGRFIQLTEMLYLILTHVDGERTLDDIAAEVAAATSRPVSANNVRYLIGMRLLPLGLVARDEQSPAPRTEAAIRSPLKVMMRRRVLTARAIDPFTKVLKILFWPPIVAIVLSAVVLTHWWVLGVRGLGDAAHQVFARPELLLVLGALMVASAVFHEFGHASALRYGGGQVRGMGVGLYLVYPALYTDVTDSYRLDRRSRVRTDLGGVYFNLIFALAVLGVYALTHQPFFLLIIPLTDLAILDEFSPFLRFDGYWALADLTGLPDLFTLMGPFVRSMLPARWRGRGVRLPVLKRWVRVVFAIYIFITVPVVGAVFALLAFTAPAIIALTVQALSQESASFIMALQSGAIGDMALSRPAHGHSCPPRTRPDAFPLFYGAPTGPLGRASRFPHHGPPRHPQSL